MALLSLAVVASADENELPTLTSPDAVFDLGTNARSLALGAAGDIFSASALGLFGNPASLVNVKRLSLGGTIRSQELNGGEYSFSNADNSFSTFAIAFNLKHGLGCLGFGVLQFGVDDIPETPDEGVSPSGSSFNSLQTGLLVSYAKPVYGDRLAIGVTFRYLRHELHDEVGTGIGFDIGLKYRFTESWYGGLAVRDGVDMEWDGYEERGVSALKYSLAGRAYGRDSFPLWIMVSATQRSNWPINASIGAEQRFALVDSGLAAGTYFLRGAFGSAFIETRDFGDHDGVNIGDISFGMGASFTGLVPKTVLDLDIAYRNGDFWDDLYFTLNVGVGN